MRQQALMRMFEDSETWPYNHYDSFQDFIENESPSLESIEQWLRKQYGKAFEITLQEYN